MKILGFLVILIGLVLAAILWIIGGQRPKKQGPAPGPQMFACAIMAALLPFLNGCAWVMDKLIVIKVLPFVVMAGILVGCNTNPFVPYIEPYIPDVTPTNAPPVVVPDPTPVETFTNATSPILGIGLPGQRLTVVVGCWEFAPASVKFSIESERVLDDGTRAWFDVACEPELTDVAGACAWAFKSREGTLFTDHYAGWRAKLVGSDQGGFPVEWDFVILANASRVRVLPSSASLATLPAPRSYRVMGEAAPSAPSNHWYAVTSGLASYHDVDGSTWATYVQAVCYQWKFLALNFGAVVPLDEASRSTPEISGTFHWPQDALRWSFESGAYIPIGRAYAEYPESIGVMLGVRRDTGL